MATKIILFSFATILCFVAHSQDNDTIKFWIQFTDKNNSPFSITQPQDFLSERAITRREKQNIPIIENDLPVNPQYIDSVLSFNSLKLHNKSKWLNGITVKTNDSANIQVLNGISFIQTIENTQKYKLDFQDKFQEEKSVKNLIIDIENTPHYPYGETYNQIHLHKADALHEYGLQGNGIHIAVIDAGFYNVDKIPGLNHLFEENRIISIKDFVAHDQSVFEDHMHGAAVLSIIAGKIDGAYWGTAHKASFHLLRSEDADSETLSEEDNWIAAAEYADSAGVDIINTSLGYTLFDDSLQNHSYNDMNGNTTRIAIAADIAASKGMLLVTSAGNSGSSPWQYISTPADADSTLTVAAVDEQGTRAFFSSVGPSADGDIKPNIASVGWYTRYLSPWDNNTGEILIGNGTSFSAPMITGMAACLWQGLPSYSNMDIKQLIEESSSQYSSPDSLLGFGIPDFEKAFQKATGVQYQVPNNSVTELFPNPFSSELTITIKSHATQNISISITNYLGQKIYHSTHKIPLGTNRLSLKPISHQNAGFYILEISFEDGKTITRKLVKT